MTSGNPARHGGAGTDLVERLPDLALYAFLALASLVIYGQSVGFPLIWDSVSLIVENPATRTFDPVAAFTTPTTVEPEGVAGDKVEQVQYYRPVLRLLVSAWYGVVGESAALWHALAALLNIVAVVLVFRLMQAMGQLRWVALAVALLFAVSPGRVSGVTWIYSLSNQVFGIFVLAAFLCWVRKARWWALGFLALALGCRETAILFPAIALIWELLFEKDKRAWTWLGGLVALVAVYLVVRFLVVGPVAWAPPSPLTWLNSVAVITSSHLHSLVWPNWGVRFYPLEDYSALSTRVLLSYGVLAGGLAALAWGLKRDRWVAFWLLWFGVWLSIHFNVGQIGEFLTAEKNNYLLALSFAALFVAVAQRARKYALVLCAVAAVAQGGLSAWRVAHWRDPATYFNSAIEQTPRFPPLHYGLAMVHVAAQDFPKAEESFLRTIELVPGHSMAWNNLGNIRFMRQDVAGAIQAWQNDFDADPGNMMAAHNLSFGYSRIGDREAAARYYSHYLKLKNAQTAAPTR